MTMQDMTQDQADTAMRAVLAAEERLGKAERACKEIPFSLEPAVYRRRLNAAMEEWRAANLALFDAQVAAMPPLPFQQA